ncbi:hypothetical protein H3H37_13355 [Duganella sp. LX20W]|uniref:Uncharacterized protein n=1 Tax=Rugamonas brunnea TaxID=2758569 RepID=A0A7W2ESY4_9BURK|nr:hypothetical protein [Rugamonas brunnea]MBA5638042.1 hypothetical protein [Rugamonas brunnea]
MTTRTRPMQATIFSALFLLSAIIMLLLGVDAHAYYIPAIALLVEAVLLWRGASLRWFKRLLELNQLTAIILILDLWLGDMLHLPKLTISASMLAANLLLGGPLMGILAIGALGAMHFSKTLPGWFQSGRA